MKDGASLDLVIQDKTGGIWHFHGLKPGKYTVAFSYRDKEAKMRGDGAVWVGEGAAKPIEIEVSDAPEAAMVR